MTFAGADLEACERCGIASNRGCTADSLRDCCKGADARDALLLDCGVDCDGSDVGSIATCAPVHLDA
jgi:hypothetical protein